MYVRFHHADRVKRQFGGEQPVPMALVNLDGFLDATARGDDRWWPDELAYWGFQLPGDVPPAALQAKDPIVLSRDAPACRRWARMQRPDIRRKGEGAASSGREDPQSSGDDEDEEAEYTPKEDIPEGVRTRIRGETAPVRTTRTSTSSQARISSWLSSWSTAGAPGQDPGRNPGTGCHRRIVTGHRVTCTSCSRAGSRPWIRLHTVMWLPVPPMMRFTGRAPLCSLTLTIPSRVRGFSTTSPPRSRSFTLHRSSNISCPRPIARRITSLHRSRRILRLHGLSHITSPPSAITHHPRSPSTTIRRPRLSARGHIGLRGIAVRPPALHRPISTIVRGTRATGIR
ncbi:hypothetical protein PIB30_059975 [Stylosanthes scabra]|uniref:Uncharacterized protein n=1 Tax=Stylosanthes scabra TaxID=79078 RepID=A0ABU6YJB2_9FABA|nr:hypothetical protein [Stylosanthes scabra]